MEREAQAVHEEARILHLQPQRFKEIGCKQLARSYKSNNTADFLLDDWPVFEDKQIDTSASFRKGQSKYQVDLLGAMLIVAV